MRPHDWAFLVEIGAGILAVVTAIRGSLLWAAGWAAVAVGADLTARAWSRTHPGPMPYHLRWVLFLPRGPHSPRRLEGVLLPGRGERILEIGPGVGIHALPIASALSPDGVLEVLDMQQEMLDELQRRARDAGITNIVARAGDAQALPYPDHTFDAAYLVCVLGEVPDGRAALRELRRALKPDGRLIVGEVLLDPDFVPLATLQEKAHEAGFRFEQKTGPGFSYFAVFRPADSSK